MTGIRIRSIMPRPTSSQLHLALLAGESETDWKSSAYQHELYSVEYGLIQQGFRVSPQMQFQKSSDGGSWLTGSFVLHLATQAAIPSLAFLGGWLKARMGRKIRLKIGNVEAEATSVEELKKLLDLATRYHDEQDG